VKKRNVAILVFDEVEVLDFAGPYEVFNVTRDMIKEPLYVYTVALVDRIIQGRGSFAIQPHYRIDNCPQPDILIVPGGAGTRPLLAHEVLLAWLREQAASTEKLMSVCTGALVLAKAGLLDGIAATTHHDALDSLQTLAPTCTVIRDQRFVDHPRFATSGGVSAGVDLSLHVVEKLYGADVVAKVRTEMEWGWYSK
jgi:transcriptional regulator GlxA family with amidase domain